MFGNLPIEKIFTERVTVFGRNLDKRLIPFIQVTKNSTIHPFSPKNRNIPLLAKITYLYSPYETFSTGVNSHYPVLKTCRVLTVSI